MSLRRASSVWQTYPPATVQHLRNWWIATFRTRFVAQIRIRFSHVRHRNLILIGQRCSNPHVPVNRRDSGIILVISLLQLAVILLLVSRFSASSYWVTEIRWRCHLAPGLFFSPFFPLVKSRRQFKEPALVRWEHTDHVHGLLLFFFEAGQDDLWLLCFCTCWRKGWTVNKTIIIIFIIIIWGVCERETLEYYKLEQKQRIWGVNFTRDRAPKSAKVPALSV